MDPEIAETKVSRDTFITVHRMLQQRPIVDEPTTNAGSLFLSQIRSNKERSLVIILTYYVTSSSNKVIYILLIYDDNQTDNIELNVNKT